MMNLQQVVPPKSTANGFGRRRGEREGGTRLENKLPSGKSNSARVTSTGALSGGKFGGFESPSHDRLLYVTTSLIGLPVDVQTKNGSIYSGIFHATSDEKEFGVILKMARLTKDGNPRGQKMETVSKAPSSIFVIPASELVQVIAKEVAVTSDGLASELQREKQHEIMIDSCISQSRHVDVERELEPWIPDEDAPHLPELENIFDGPWNRNWDQFEINETLFGVKTTFDEEIYTTKLLRGPKTKELEREAMRIAREIEGEDTQDLHLAEERGMNLHESFDIDEETRFSSVYRDSALDDSGYEEDEDIMLDSRNDETFGGPSASVSQRPADFTSGKRNDAARVSSSSSLVQDEAQSSHSSTVADPQRLVSYDLVRQMASETPHKSISTLDSEKRFEIYRVHENLPGEHGGNSYAKEFLDKHLLPEDAQLSKSEDSESLESNVDGFDKVGLSANASAYAPSRAPSKSNEKTSSPGEQLEAPAPSKAPGEPQSVISRGRPGSSASSTSECAVAASASSGPGLSPSSSGGSMSSERSTLNPHAKEFKLNPNAKSFVPSQAGARPQSPVTDSPFYHPPNVSAVPHIPGMPVGFGIGPAFAGHQPVIYNPQVPMQSPQAYYHPHGPQYGQQMVVGQSRPLFYMQSYQQPEMPYKGREF
ncbi:polyadenylate-binding protein-interacting protein 3-like isoform X1 [Pistacia vera]|uniref:polyadenylate-binding protein-interacting protein 3-like isoform X1 n=1 Tax=Pistacia vera TaxID=55513 RepID=UPI001262DDCF|nr:polyadenylate-binding protein-interacting protein 3-like isoform X1 [Pistacia vera]